MKLAIASGKGGTGKTTLSCAIALLQKEPVCLLDCDVEEPNAHFFIHPNIARMETTFSLVPEVNPFNCTGCGECGRVCQFSAIVSLGQKTLTFPELCHSCGACARICPSGAIKEVPEQTGQLAVGSAGNITFIAGRLDVGQAMSPPVIRETLKHAADDGLTIVDCPPGTSCPFVSAVKGCDAVLLVTEPTPFGLHDLKLAVETIRELGIPFAVAVNRVNSHKNRISEYCEAEAIPLVLQLPENRRVAEAYSRGESLISAMPERADELGSLPNRMEALL